ncbi:hypothetical protein CDAR_104511 [Caerostris darwini]|uniref:Uncharacterized protein n=1 Tax=Caerostris darwini TaxID=1538125 RepID=A0AAV4PUI6_9ARAC|nr:hypothetical protein CDAR_104511 [Caerostris darwini]
MHFSYLFQYCFNALLLLVQYCSTPICSVPLYSCLLSTAKNTLLLFVQYSSSALFLLLQYCSKALLLLVQYCSNAMLLLVQYCFNIFIARSFVSLNVNQFILVIILCEYLQSGQL